MKKLILAVAIPCLALASMAIYNQSIIMTAPEYEFEIEGYDPRDILAGHYLVFRIKYPIDPICDHYQPAAMCVHPEFKVMKEGEYTGCDQWITGRCDGKKFTDQLNRFYIPEAKAYKLEAKVRHGKATIKVAVGKGNAVIKDLLIDGKSWKDVE